MIAGTKQETPNPVAVHIGKRIRALRRLRGMKQDALARDVGYSSHSAIAQFENGLAVPSVDKALEIARVLGVTIGELLGDQESSEAAVPSREAERVAIWAETRCHALAMTLRAFASELDAFATR